MTREAALARTLVELADTLVADFDVVDLLTRLSDGCVEVLEIDAVGIVLAAPDGGLRSVASSSETVHLLDLVALAEHEGPSHECFRIGKPVVNLNLPELAERWPHFTPQAVAAGFNSVHALPLRLRGSVLGALTLMRRVPGDIAPDDVAIAQAFADIATIAILQHRAASDAIVLNEQLNHALNSRIVIEQAKGMIAEHARVAPAEAFLTLREHARHHNLRLVDVAERVIDRTLSVSALRPARPSSKG